MSDPLSSDDGRDSSYDNLIDRIYNSQRPPSDEEVSKSVKVESWFIMQKEKVELDINTSNAEILSKAYVHGLPDVREAVGLDNLNEIGEIKVKFMEAFEDRDGDYVMVDVDEIYYRMREISADVETKMGNKPMENVTVPMPNSVHSEVCTKYMSHLSLSSDVHRICLTAGLADADITADTVNEYKEQMLENLDESVKEIREVIEKEVCRFIEDVVFEWREREINREHAEEIQEVLDLMETDYGRRARYRLESIDLEDDNE